MASSLLGNACNQYTSLVTATLTATDSNWCTNNFPSNFQQAPSVTIRDQLDPFIQFGKHTRCGLRFGIPAATSLGVGIAFLLVRTLIACRIREFAP